MQVYYIIYKLAIFYYYKFRKSKIMFYYKNNSIENY